MYSIYPLGILVVLVKYLEDYERLWVGVFFCD